MQPVHHVDALVIGAGQAGVPLATALAGAGHDTVLVEKVFVGGTCVNTGCTPTKTMVASARVAHLARRAGDFGVRTGEVSVDMEAVRRRKRDIVARFREGSVSRVEDADGLELVRGRARFTGPRRVLVVPTEGDERTITAERVFVNAGTRARRPPIDGIDDVPWLDNATIMELGALPEHLLILGGGYIGLEFGQMFRRFGSRITIVQRGDQLLSREDRDVAEEVRSFLEAEGVEVLTGAEARRVEPLAADEGGDGAPDGGVRLVARHRGEERSVEGSHLLVAIGREPNTGDLGLDAAGIETDAEGYITVNARLETSAEGVWALGDVKGGPAFTHISYDDFRIVRANLLEDGDRTTGDRPVPYTVFVDPQLARVGMSESRARDAGRDVRVAKLPMSHVARALETEETRGFMKAVVDAETDEILGCAIVGPQAGETMAVVEVAMMAGLPWQKLRDGVFAHPTFAESLNNLFMTLEGRS